MSDPPADIQGLLYPLFDELRRHRVPVGVPEYRDAIRAVRDGLHGGTVDGLKRVCRLLWAKSREDAALLDGAFERRVTPRLRTTPGAKGPAGGERDDGGAPGVDPRPLHLTQVFYAEGALDGAAGRPSFDRGADVPAAGPDRWRLVPRPPLSGREMARAFRQLREMRAEGPADELDVAETVDRLCRLGVFMGPALRPRRRNQARLLALIDRQGSMAPFGPLMDVLADSVRRGGLLGRARIRYFHDCPEDEVYENPDLTETVSLEDALGNDRDNWRVLVVSDAGAARGYFDGERVEATRAFLDAVSARAGRWAWLNPMPRIRWPGTTAAEVAAMTPMFPLDRDGLNDAVAVLRGKPHPVGARRRG
jgi:uncharacterized protein with von Willebrand factor type A (vWA) domain